MIVKSEKYPAGAINDAQPLEQPPPSYDEVESESGPSLPSSAAVESEFLVPTQSHSVSEPSRSASTQTAQPAPALTPEREADIGRDYRNKCA